MPRKNQDPFSVRCGMNLIGLRMNRNHNSLRTAVCQMHLKNRKAFLRDILKRRGERTIPADTCKRGIVRRGIDSPNLSGLPINQTVLRPTIAFRPLTAFRPPSAFRTSGRAPAM